MKLAFSLRWPVRLAGAALLASIAADGLCGGGEGRFVLFDGGSGVRISVPAKPEPSSLLAAEELTTYIGRATGVVPAVGVADGAAAVVVGTIETLSGLPAGVRERLLEMPEKEASWTGVADGKLWFVGKEESAELGAVYRFLEERLGVRWFNVPTPEDPGEYVPSLKTIAFEPFSRFRAPDFGIRRLDYTGAACFPLPTNSMTYAVRIGFQVPPTQQIAIPYDNPGSPLTRFFAPRQPRRMQSLGGWHHSFRQGNPPETFKEHPECFALVDGKRTRGRAGDEQYCLSCPLMRSNTVAYILGRLRANGGKGEYIFGQADIPHGMCECEECRALDSADERNASSSQNKTTRFFKTVNAVAGEVFKEFPDADIRMWAYANYREIPAVKIDPRIKMVWFCPHGRCYGHVLDDPKCPRNVGMFRLMKRWMETMPQLYLYDYLTCTPQLYTCNELQEAHDIRLYKRLGVVGWKNEISFPDQNFVGKSKNPKVLAMRADRVPSNWQWMYVTAHLLWDASLDENSVLADVESKYYGRAYPAMRRYHALRRKTWSENNNCMGYPTGDQRRPTLLDKPSVKDGLLLLLAEAERMAAGDQLLLSRIGRDRAWLERYWIEANEELKKKRGNKVVVPAATGSIVIDGSGEDPAWGAAFFTDDLRRAFVPPEKRVPMAPELATTFGLTFDKDNVYVLATVKEPAPAKMKCGDNPRTVWDDDCVEVLLFPPSAENRCYHFAVNAKGTVYGGTRPGGFQEGAFGVEAKTKVLRDRYVVEMRIPAAKVCPIAEGDVWRVQFARNRLVKDALTPDGNGRWSFDGEDYGNTLAYRTMEFGRPYLRNGMFAEVTAKGWPKHWAFLSSCCGVVDTKYGKALKLLSPQSARQAMAHRELGQGGSPRPLVYSFVAFGKGRVKVTFDRYTDTADPNAKNGYTRKRHPADGVGGVYELTDAPQTFTGTYTVAAGEWCTLALASEGGEAYLQSVRVEKTRR